MLIIGLTGSIGTGKSATARMFAARGAPVHDADAAVHRLYAAGGAAVAPVAAAFPGVVRDGAIDRALLGKHVLGDDAAMAKLEAIVHPLVHGEEKAFLAAARGKRVRQAVIEVPLLLETGGAVRCDCVVVVTVAADIQRQRVLARPGMGVEKLSAILAKQMSDAEKRRRAHFIIDTGFGFAAAEQAVADIMRAVACMPGRS